MLRRQVGGTRQLGEEVGNLGLVALGLHQIEHDADGLLGLGGAEARLGGNPRNQVLHRRNMSNI